jgi:hypothetical protein
MSATEGPYPTVNRVNVDPAEVANYRSESQYVALSSRLLKEVASYVCLAACTMGTNPGWSRDQAAVGGNMVRLFKLIAALLDQTAQRRRETSHILVRLAFEAVVNVRYMTAHFSPALIESYIRHSLRHERRLWDTINDNIAKRGGEVQPIEQRMLKSLDRTERVAGISLGSVDPKDNRYWGGKSLREKAKIVGLDSAYLMVFGPMSHNVHGAWHDLYQFHLKTDGAGGFIPNLDWGRPLPQVLFAIGVIAVEAVHDFVDFRGQARIEPFRRSARRPDISIADCRSCS